MRKKLVFIIIGILLSAICISEVRAQMSILDSLTTPDPNIRKYFPRWKICEIDMQIQIRQAFILMGYDEKELDISNIEVMAAPHRDPFYPYELLVITCGNASITSTKIYSQMNRLAEYISGRYSYQSDRWMEPIKRDYCFVDIPPELPLTTPQSEAILDFLKPTNVTHAFSLSLFEQSLKIGDTDFWLVSKLGTDEVGYHFWQPGEAKITLRRPLYMNSDPVTRGRIPTLLNAYLGGGYRITSGIDASGTALSWIGSRTLNAGPGGKLIAGLDLNMPFHPEFGVHFNLELPLEAISYQMAIEPTDYGNISAFRNGQMLEFDVTDPRYVYGVEAVIPLIRATGQFTLFYNLWLNKENPENYFRFDLGLSYAEVREMALYRDTTADISYMTNIGVEGLNTYKPNEFGDWIYAKVEYRSHAKFPFGLSAQYSNQILLGRIYIPLISNWLYIEGKYATPLRSVRPFEKDNFFVISPVLRITL